MDAPEERARARQSEREVGRAGTEERMVWSVECSPKAMAVLGCRVLLRNTVSGGCRRRGWLARGAPIACPLFQVRLGK